MCNIEYSGPGSVFAEGVNLDEGAIASRARSAQIKRGTAPAEWEPLRAPQIT